MISNKAYKTKAIERAKRDGKYTPSIHKKAETEWTVSQTWNKGLGSLYVGQNPILHIKNPSKNN